MKAGELKKIIGDIPDDAEVDVGGTAATESIIGVIQDTDDEDSFHIITRQFYKELP